MLTTIATSKQCLLPTIATSKQCLLQILVIMYFDYDRGCGSSYDCDDGDSERSVWGSLTSRKTLNIFNNAYFFSFRLRYYLCYIWPTKFK